MRFEVTQAIAASPSAVLKAYLDEQWYEAAAALPRLGAPEVLSIDRHGDTATTRVRYRFAGELSPAVTAVVDPKRLTWVEVAEHDLASGIGKFALEPDHYPSLLNCRGTTAVTDGDNGGSIRRIAADLRVKVLLVGGQVERAIVSGLEEHLQAEAALMSRWTAERK